MSNLLPYKLCALGFLLALTFPAQAQTTYTVCNSMCTYTGSQLQTAINTAAANQDAGACASSADEFIVSITPGTTIPDGNYIIPNKTCNQYVRIKNSTCPVSAGTRIAPANAASMPKIQAPIGIGETAGVFTTADTGGTSHYWSFECLYLTVATGSTTINFVNWIVGIGTQDLNLAAQYDHFTFDRNLIEGQVQQNGPLRGIYLGDVSDVVIDSNYITEIHEKSGDSQAVYGSWFRNNLTITNDYLAASGENVMFGGTGQKRTGNIPNNIQIYGNLIDKPYAWAYYSSTANPVNGTNHCMNGMSWFNSTTNHRWQCDGSDTWIDQGVDTSHMVYDTKGGIELKHAQNVQMWGNVFTGGWLPQAGLADAQPFTVFPVNQVDMFPWEVILDVTTSFNKADYPLEYSYNSVIGSYTQGPGRIYHHDDLVTALGDGRTMPLGNPDSQNVGTSNYSNALYGQLHYENLTVARSTYAGSTVRLLGLLAETAANWPGTPNSFINNIAPYGFYGYVSIGAGGGSGACAYLAQLAVPSGASLGGNIFSTEDGTGITTGTVSPGCSNANHLWPTGTLSNALITNIIDGSYQPKVGFQNTGTDGRNAGPNLSMLNAMILNTAAGTPNPMLTTWVNSISPSATGVVVQATLYDSNTCTWELSTDGGAYTSPIAVSSQSQVGRAVTARWNPGTLAPSTTYYVGFTCGVQPRQEWMAYGTARAKFTTLAGAGTNISGKAVISGKTVIH